jgi:hypothetical protein
MEERPQNLYINFSNSFLTTELNLHRTQKKLSRKQQLKAEETEQEFHLLSTSDWSLSPTKSEGLHKYLRHSTETAERLHIRCKLYPICFFKNKTEPHSP